MCSLLVLITFFEIQTSHCLGYRCSNNQKVSYPEAAISYYHGLKTIYPFYVSWHLPKLLCKSQIMSRNLGPNHLAWIDFVKTIISQIWAVSNCKIKYHLSQIATLFNHHTSKTKICTLFFAWLCKKTGIVLWYQL